MFFGYYGSTSPPEFSTPGGQARERWYGSSAWPTAMFDGRLGPQVQEIDSFYPVFRNMIDGARAVESWVEMRLGGSTGVDTAQVTLAVEVTPTDSTVNRMGNLRLVAVVYEDSLAYEFLGETLYARTVVRAVVGDSFGLPLALTFGQEFETTLIVPSAGWDPARVGAAVFVQDHHTKTVLQSVGRRRLQLKAGG